MEGIVTEVPFSMVVATGCLTVLLASLLAYAMRSKSSLKDTTTRLPEEPEKKKKAPVDRTKYPGGEITVYYATQTGTAESFGRDLEREGADKGFLVHVVDLEDVSDLSSLKGVGIFLTATYGEGESPDNANQFVDMLKEATGMEILDLTPENADPTALHDLNFAVFGLGNKQYDHYNAMGKFFDKSLEVAGAKRIAEIGLGNDDDDLESDFEKWKDYTLWPTLCEKHLPKDAVVNGTSKTLILPDCPIKVIYHSGGSKPGYNLPENQIHNTSRHYFTAVECPISLVRELRSSQDPGSTVHVELDVSKTKSLRTGRSVAFAYTTADNLGVLPVNTDHTVEFVAHALGYDLDAVISVEAAGNHEWHGAPFPMPISIRECLTRFCDLTGSPRRSDLKMLAAYCRDDMDQKALLRMSSKEGRSEYKEKIVEGYVGLVDLMKLCPSIEMPLEHFLSFCSPMQTRFFTISSSSSVHPKSVHLTVAVTDNPRPDGTVFHGVCSNFLANKPSTARVFIRPSTFRLPADVSRPIIMIGPGTGVAPMRAFLQEREFQKKRGSRVGKNVLYFGCKHESLDYIYKDELQQFKNDGVLDILRIAFSRESAVKFYVQHLLKQNAAETWDFIEKQAGYIYVCGGVKMGQDVMEALKEIVASHGKLTPEAAKEYLNKLSHNGRFVQELWA